MVREGSARGATTRRELGASLSRSAMNRWSPRWVTSYSTSVSRGRTTRHSPPAVLASRTLVSLVTADPVWLPTIAWRQNRCRMTAH